MVVGEQYVMKKSRILSAKMVNIDVALIKMAECAMPEGIAQDGFGAEIAKLIIMDA